MEIVNASVSVKLSQSKGLVVTCFFHHKLLTLYERTIKINQILDIDLM